MAKVTAGYSPEEKAKADAGGGRPMEDGWYVLLVKSATVESAKKADAYPNVVLKCEVQQSHNGKHVGGVVTRRFNLHPKSVPYNLIPFIKAIGAPMQDLGGQGIEFDPDHFVGAVTKVTLKVKQGATRPQEDWNNDEPFGGAQAGAPRVSGRRPGGRAPPGFGQAPQAPQPSPMGGWAPPGATQPFPPANFAQQ